MSSQEHDNNHRRICELVLERDVEAAVKELRSHIAITTELILAGHPDS
jgi:DNA-binding GntR family transcriptional regulator